MMHTMTKVTDADKQEKSGTTPVRPKQPLWAKIVAWGVIATGAVYIANPTLGVFELLPDNLPGVGNLDEAAVVFIILAAMRYLGMRLPEFVERYARVPELPAGDSE
jgi:hypothetical protein